MSIEAMKQALEALKRIEHPDQSDVIDVLHQAIREHALREVQRLGQEIEQEPVAWVQDVEFEQLPEFAFSWVKTKLHDQPLYAHPPQRTEERNFCPRCGKRTNDIHTCTPPQRTEEKNT